MISCGSEGLTAVVARKSSIFDRLEGRIKGIYTCSVARTEVSGSGLHGVISLVGQHHTKGRVFGVVIYIHGRWVIDAISGGHFCRSGHRSTCHVSSPSESFATRECGGANLGGVATSFHTIVVTYHIVLLTIVKDNLHVGSLSV